MLYVNANSSATKICNKWIKRIAWFKKNKTDEFNISQYQRLIVNLKYIDRGVEATTCFSRNRPMLNWEKSYAFIILHHVYIYFIDYNKRQWNLMIHSHVKYFPILWLIWWFILMSLLGGRDFIAIFPFYYIVRWWFGGSVGFGFCLLMTRA